MIQPADDGRALYGFAYERAKRYALRYVGGEEAAEVGHDIAVVVVCRGMGMPSDLTAERLLCGFIHRAVVNRLIDRKRRGDRRAEAELDHAADLLDSARQRDDLASTVELRELTAVVTRTVQAMPPRMRTVFLLVRDHGRAYREVADTLGIGVGSVHTHLSRAYALLRDAIERYRSDGNDHGSRETGRQRGGIP